MQGVCMQHPGAYIVQDGPGADTQGCEGVLSLPRQASLHELRMPVRRSAYVHMVQAHAMHVVRACGACMTVQLRAHAGSMASRNDSSQARAYSLQAPVRLGVAVAEWRKLATC